MSVVDAPPGRDFAGPAVGEFRSRPASRRLARATFIVCLINGMATLALASRHLYAPGTTLLVLGPMVCGAIATVGLGVRLARVRIDAGGISWGWGRVGFGIGPERIESLRYYGRGLAVMRKRAAPWYLSGYDWAGFDEVPNACKTAGLPLERSEGRPPLRVQMQAYGVVLDVLLMLTILGSLLLLAFAALR